MGSMLLIFLFFSVILCFVCLRYVSCVPNVVSVGGLSICDYHSVFYACLTLPPFNESACVFAFLVVFLLIIYVRGVRRYQRGNQNPHIEEEQTTQ